LTTWGWDAKSDLKYTFDNIGGEMLEVAVANMNAFGGIAACGEMHLL
jgi:NADPH-dependent curcumin reductase CurA